MNEDTCWERDVQALGVRSFTGSRLLGQEGCSLGNEIHWKSPDSAPSNELEQTKYGFLKAQGNFDHSPRAGLNPSELRIATRLAADANRGS